MSSTSRSAGARDRRPFLPEVVAGGTDPRTWQGYLSSYRMPVFVHGSVIDVVAGAACRNRVNDEFIGG